MVRELQPGILINNRTEIPQDLYTPEQYQPRGWMHVDGKPVVWEACQTLNGSWGYDRDNLDWKSPEMLLRMLIDGVSKGSNLLLNVGPTARGEFDPRALWTLDEIGQWVRLHTRSIYGCTQSEFQAPPDCRLTQNLETNRLYLHLFAWPFRHVHLDGLVGRVAYAQLLNDASEIRTQEGASRPPAGNTNPGGIPTNTLTLRLPIQKPGVAVPVIELFLRGS